jgi:hypothetical protein
MAGVHVGQLQSVGTQYPSSSGLNWSWDLSDPGPYKLQQADRVRSSHAQRSRGVREVSHLTEPLVHGCLHFLVQADRHLGTHQLQPGDEDLALGGYSSFASDEATEEFPFPTASRHWPGHGSPPWIRRQTPATYGGALWTPWTLGAG